LCANYEKYIHCYVSIDIIWLSTECQRFNLYCCCSCLCRGARTGPLATLSQKVARYLLFSNRLKSVYDLHWWLSYRFLLEVSCWKKIVNQSSFYKVMGKNIVTQWQLANGFCPSCMLALLLTFWPCLQHIWAEILYNASQHSSVSTDSWRPCSAEISL